MRQLFGTDGIRGIANKYPIDAETIVKIGRAAAKVFKNGKTHHRILIGKDTRLSGYMIENALVSGICSEGVDVLLVGPMPTPAIAHLTKSFGADAGIVISASHNPYQDNGIKFFSKEGTKLPDAIEEKIESHIFDREEKKDHNPENKIGKAFRIDDAQGRYIEYVKHTAGNRSITGLKIILDCANGAAYHVAPDIFKELGAEVIVLNNTPDGININENCGAMHPELIQKQVIAHKADAGIALDGDADRIIMADENGNVIDGDQIIAICAESMAKKRKLRNKTVVTTIMSNLGLKIALEKQGIKLIQTQVGDRYVTEEMLKRQSNLGGEQSGHVVFSDYNTTGDGIITGLQVLSIMAEEHKKLSELSAAMKKFPQIILNVNVKEKKEFQKMPEVDAAIKNAEKELGENGRVLVRYSGTQNMARVMIEGEDEVVIKKLAEKIIQEIKKEIG